ncbi:MAG TPA: type II toxin-antitoxin system VapC family toxin [Longimicrobiales bacterium]|nr:type II toxin-antitoxin system VapC family toxin [Longimicrobiales bacterium]
MAVDVIFVDTNLFMYAVGREHPLRAEAQDFFLEQVESGTPLVTSSEVLQELLHAYVPVGRLATLDAALELATSRTQHIWSVEREDVETARHLVTGHPGLGARDLLHLACCMRRGVSSIRTFDRGLAAAMAG